MFTLFTAANCAGHSPGLELLGTQRVADVLNGVTQTVGEVIRWIDTPEEWAVIYSVPVQEFTTKGNTH